MRETLVLTIIGLDRSGLVEGLSQTVADHDGNWEESRMAHLAGRFAGILQVSVPTERADGLTRALNTLAGRGLRIVVEPAHTAASADVARRLQLSVVGHDREGIVRAVSSALAEHAINVEELYTRRASAPMSGDLIFHIDAQLLCTPLTDLESLRSDLENIADDLMIDLTRSEEA